MSTIAEFKAAMGTTGVRPNQFRVYLSFPAFVAGGILAAQKTQFLCKAAILPESTVEDIDIKFRGRQVHYPGERTFKPWTITVYNEETFVIRNAFEEWQNGIQQYSTTLGLTLPSQFQVDMQVHQLNRNGDPIKVYNFVDVYPSNIGQIQLDFEQQNTIETFDVEFIYNYFTSNSTQGNGLNVSGVLNSPFGSIPVTSGN